MQTGIEQSFTPVGTGILQKKCALSNTPGLVKDRPERDEGGLTLQRSPVDQAEPSAVPPIVHEVLRSSGQPLDPATRTFMEPRFGHDFSRMRVHSTGQGMIQTKLKINEPGDIYEQEADRVADEVMRMSEPQVQQQAEEEDLIQTESIADQITPLVQRQVEPEEEEELIQIKTVGDVTPELTPTISSGIQSLQGGGRPLSGSERSFFEPRFGEDFSNVRVHNNTQAASIAQSVNARAFTHGRNVVFGAGEHSQDTLAGRKLLAHELTHVVQQNGGPTLFSASKNFENTIPKAQKLSIVSPNFPVQRSLVWVPIGLAALGVVLYACAEPFVQISRRRYGNKSDKWRHCWVSCEISKTCGSAIAQLAGLTQEAQNLLVHGQPLIRSLLDMLANGVCIPPETAIVGVLARLWRQSCEDCCNEAERQGVLPMLEQMEEEALEQMEEEAEEEATLQTKPLVGHTPPLMQRQVGPPEQTTSLGTQAIASPDLQHRITALQGSGQPLSQAERNFFEPRFGVDFSQVRIHANRHGSENARAISARAFTVGKNIVFGAGQYAPQTNDGKRLLAHELTHVVQQTAGGSFQKNLKSISKFINTGEQISRFLRIRGGAVFEREVNSDLGQLRGATAQNLLSTLRSSWGKTVEINRVQGVCGTRMVNDIVLVFYNPSRCPIAPRDDVWDGPSVPKAIYLAHELIHALHHIEDTHDSSRPVEEWQTVGLGRYATLSTTENRIRCEMGLPLRTFYYADDQQRYRLQGFNPPRC